MQALTTALCNYKLQDHEDLIEIYLVAEQLIKQSNIECHVMELIRSAWLSGWSLEKYREKFITFYLSCYNLHLFTDKYQDAVRIVQEYINYFQLTEEQIEYLFDRTFSEIIDIEFGLYEMLKVKPAHKKTLAALRVLYEIIKRFFSIPSFKIKAEQLNRLVVAWDIDPKEALDRMYCDNVVSVLGSLSMVWTLDRYPTEFLLVAKSKLAKRVTRTAFSYGEPGSPVAYHSLEQKARILSL